MHQNAPFRRRKCQNFYGHSPLPRPHPHWGGGYEIVRHRTVVRHRPMSYDVVRSVNTALGVPRASEAAERLLHWKCRSVGILVCLPLFDGVD